MRRILWTAVALTAVLAACSKPLPPAPGGVSCAFDLDAPGGPGAFFDFPWPSDLRRTSRGTPDFRGFPNPQTSDIVTGLVQIAMDRPGFPVTPTAYFQFDGGLAALPDGGGSLLLLDVDPASPETGRSFPVVASVVEPDAYAPAHLLAVSPPPGVVLHGDRTYAFVVRRGLGDDTGAPLGVPEPLWKLAHGVDPGGPNGGAAAASYAPLWEALRAQGVDPGDVAAAAVFTTGDVVAALASLSSQVIARDPVSVTGLARPADGGLYQGFCEVDGVVSFPKYQQGQPPFQSQGTFAIGLDGLPARQGQYDAVPLVLTFPQGAMPDGGYPLVLYFHGSGGVSRAAIERGTAVLDGGAWMFTPGKGPAWVLAPYGFATAAAALPLNPERLPGAADIAYLNLSNLAAFRDTFRQGVIEQRALLAALRSLSLALSPADLAACGIQLPAGESSLRYAPEHLFAQGQSMGGMYTNLVSAVEPRILAAVPTGAGGHWQSFVLDSPQVPQGALPLLLGTGANATWQHPTLMLLETAWEPAEPMVYAARLGRRPLPGHPVRPVYEPVGTADSYFAQATYDAMALAYGHKQAGSPVWPSMQDALQLEQLGGLVGYPVSQDVPSEAGGSRTGVVAQYADPTGYDGHAIYTQVDAVKHQYACFFSTFLQTGTATVVAPGAVGAPCK